MVDAFPSFESRWVTLDGCAIHYLTGGAGPPLVLVHGLGSAAGVEFYFNLEALASRHRVIGLDLPGFGKSDKPRVVYDIPYFDRMVQAFLDSQGLSRVALMGVSLGGRVALGFALDRPTRVSKLVLVDALGMGRPRRALAYVFLLARGLGELTLTGTARALRRMNPRTVRRLWGLYLSRPGSIDHILTDDRIQSHRDMLDSPAYRAAYLSTLRSVAGMRRLREGVALEERLPELPMPTLLLWGRHDHIFPVSHAEEAARRIPNARLTIFEDSGHTPQMEEPERFNQAVLEFLNG